MYKFGIFGISAIFVFQYVKQWILIFYSILKSLNFELTFLKIFIWQTITDFDYMVGIYFSLLIIPYICCFLPHLHHIVLVNVKLDISGYKGITFQS